VPSTSDHTTMVSLLRSFDVRLSRQERHSHRHIDTAVRAEVAELRDEVAALRAEIEMLRRGGPSGQTKQD
jgi:uncharacterized protein YceH (UPF0502 family)